MGRYYNGDIEGKFWFAVQSSDDGDHFGDEGTSSALDYYFDKDDHLESINKGIKECIKGLGDWKDKLDKFFKNNDSYNNKMLWDQIGLSNTETKEILEIYARLELGNQIKECVEKNGTCSFSAEL
tara:strand:+ start:839 stop:1213 length:375 start_codon:yes stop_codon:yes gene_type:complete